MVDCEIHVVKLEVNLTNFTGLWGGIFSTLPSLELVIELSALAGLRSLSCVSLPTPVIGLLKASHTSLSYGLLILSLPFFSSIFPSRMPFPTPPP